MTTPTLDPATIEACARAVEDAGGDNAVFHAAAVRALAVPATPEYHATGDPPPAVLDAVRAEYERRFPYRLGEAGVAGVGKGQGPVSDSPALGGPAKPRGAR